VEAHPDFPRVVVLTQNVDGFHRASGSRHVIDIHGDLHHENLLLDAVRGGIAIDPKGVIGPRVMECGRFLHNFLDDEIERDTIEDRAAIVQCRCEVLADVMNAAPEKLAVAGYVDAVLGTCWTLNDGGKHLAREADAIVTLV